MLQEGGVEGLQDGLMSAVPPAPSSHTRKCTANFALQRIPYSTLTSGTGLGNGRHEE